MSLPAIVLTAGLATRLRPLSLVRAKAALPVAGEPLAARILRGLREADITEAVLNLHHLPHTLTGRIGDGSPLGLRVRYSWETLVLGSAGGPKKAFGLLDAARALIVNGDTLSTVDIRALAADHARGGALVTMAVVPNREPGKYRGLRLDAEGRVIGRTDVGAAEPSWHFTGVQIAEARAFDGVPPEVPYETTAELYPALWTAHPGAVRAFRCDAGFLDIGTPADYLATARSIAAREHRSPHGAGCRIDPTARLDGSVLWDRVVVEPGVSLRECVVTDDVTVPADTSWHGVSIRRASPDLAPGEKRIGQLAIASL